MKTSEKFKRKVLARWRVLSAGGVDLVRAAVEIGVAAADLEVWIREASGSHFCGLVGDLHRHDQLHPRDQHPVLPATYTAPAPCA